MLSLLPARPRRAPRPSAAGDDDAVDAAVKAVVMALADVDTSLPWTPRDDAVGLALLDAVFSVRTTYGSPSSGVRAWVAAYAAESTGSGDDLQQLVRDADLLRRLADEGRLTRQRLTGGALKVEAVVDAATLLAHSPGCPRSAADVRTLLPEAYEALRAAYVSVGGLGVSTFEYFLLLVGAVGDQAGAAVTAFVTQSLAAAGAGAGAAEDPDRCLALLVAAGAQLDLTPTQAVHAVWRAHTRRDQSGQG